jgi:hypothetical protein
VVDSPEGQYDSLILNRTWSAIDDAPKKPIRTKLILKKKRSPDGSLDKYKARLVALSRRRYLQKKGIDCEDLFAPVAKKTSFLVSLHMVASQDLECDVGGFLTAFLNGVLPEDIYIEAPSHSGKPGQPLKLHRALYGLQDAPREWYRTLKAAMVKQVFEISLIDAGLSNEKVMIAPALCAGPCVHIF